MDGAPAVRLLPDQSNAVYVPADTAARDGHLLFRRGTALMALPSTPGRYALKFDLVSEGIDWFEKAGSPTTTRDVVVQ